MTREEIAEAVARVQGDYAGARRLDDAVRALPVIATCGECGWCDYPMEGAAFGLVCLHPKAKIRSVDEDDAPPSECPLRQRDILAAELAELRADIVDAQHSSEQRDRKKLAMALRDVARRWSYEHQNSHEAQVVNDWLRAEADRFEAPKARKVGVSPPPHAHPRDEAATGDE